MPDPSAVDAAVAVFADLREEGRELDSLVGELAVPDWARTTPAPGWTVAHQIAHLHWTDRASLLSLTDATGFGHMVEEALKAPDTFVDEGAREGAELAPPSCSPAGAPRAPPSARRWPRPRPTPASPGTGRR